MPGGLGPQPQLVHELDQLALAVAGRRLGLLGLHAVAQHPQPLAFLERGQYMLLGLAVRIVVSPSRLYQAGSTGPEGLGTDIHLEAGGIPDTGLRQGGKEAAHHQLIDLPLVILQASPLQCGSGIDGGMVGGLSLSPGRLHLALEKPGRLLGEGPRQEQPGKSGQIYGGGIDGVVRPGIGDEAVGVEPFRYAHGIGGGQADSAGGSDKAGGVKWGRRPIYALLGFNGGDDALRPQAGDYSVYLALLPDAALGMLHPQLLFQIGVYLPVWLGHK